MADSKKTNEPRYIVNVELQAFDIPKANAAMTLMKRDGDGGLLGTMQIGQGSLRWKPSYGKKFKRIEWAKLAKVLDDA